VKLSPNSIAFLSALVFSNACSDEAAEERREFSQLEAAVGMVANGGHEDRGIRLEQLEAMTVRFERNANLRKVCVSAYRAFESAVMLLEKAKIETAKAETDVADAERRQAQGMPPSPEEQSQMVTLGKQAADSLQSMTKALDEAQKLVTECQEERNRLRFQLAPK
jgi:hypothetical protein